MSAVSKRILGFSTALVCSLAAYQASAADINVGLSRTYKTLAAGVAAANAGDRILLDAGTYVDNTAITAVPLTIEGQGAGAILHMSGNLPNRKGILVTGATTTLRNITFDGAKVAEDDGNNGAGVRAEGGSLIIDNCAFTNNQNGILVNAIPGAVVNVSNSRFDGNGANDGFTHGMYVNEVAQLAVTTSTFNGTRGGHNIKSRAIVTTVSDTTLDDGVTGTTSYALDFPNGGDVTVSNVKITQGSHSVNGAMIAYGAEGNLKVVNNFTVSNSTFTNGLNAPSAAAVYNYTSVPAQLVNDDLAQVPIALRGAGTIQGGKISTTQRTASVFSNGQPAGQSFLRFYNSGDAPGTVTVTLRDPVTGAALSAWKSPAIPPRAAPQIDIPTIEAAAAQAFPIPAQYSVTIHADINGYFQHVLYRPQDGTLSNLSACDGHPISIPIPYANSVHSSLLSAGFPSSVVFYNTGDAAKRVVVGVYDARNGTRLGTYTSAEIAPLAQLTVTVDSMEDAIGVKPGAGMYQYNIKLDNDFTGTMQHLVNNKAAGLITDMTNACPLNN